MKLRRLALLLIMPLSLLLMAQTTKHQLLQEDVGMINCRQFGVTLNAATVNACMAAVGAGTRIAILPPGNWTLASNVTVPAGVTLYIPAGTVVAVTSGVLNIVGVMKIDNGGILCPSPPGTVSVNGSLDLPRKTVFCSAAGIAINWSSHMTEIRPEWWGALADDVHDDTTAIVLAIQSQKDQVVQLSAGSYRITSTIVIDTPVHLRGMAAYGGQTLLRRDSAMSADVLIIHAPECEIEGITFYDNGTTTTRGGGPIRLTGTSLTNRANFTNIHNIRVLSAAAGGAWAYDLLVDGSSFRTAGNAGIRNLIVSDSYFSGARTDSQTIFLETCVQCFFSNVTVVPAPTSVVQGVFISGWDGTTNWSDHIHFSNCFIDGNFKVFGKNVTFFGGAVGQSVSGAPSINIPPTSNSVTINALILAESGFILNQGSASYIAPRQTAAGGTVAQTSFPIGGLPLEGYIITGSGTVPDYQGITRVYGNVNGGAVSRIEAGVLNAGSTWEFGVSNNYSLGVNKIPVKIDSFGLTVNLGYVFELGKVFFADLGGLSGDGRMVNCADCIYNSNPCAGGGTGAVAKFVGALWRC